MNLLVNYPILILYYKNNCFREIHKKIKIPSFQISVKNFVYILTYLHSSSLFITDLVILFQKNYHRNTVLLDSKTNLKQAERKKEDATQTDETHDRYYRCICRHCAGDFDDIIERSTQNWSSPATNHEHIQREDALLKVTCNARCRLTGHVHKRVTYPIL